jgi:hypothetical protein
MIIDELFESPQQCPECGGISFSDLILAEKKDACYHKVKASAKVWPSAYASGRLVQCRKKGAANYGKSKTESVSEGVGNIGDQIKAVYQKIYDQGDDAIEFMYNDSPIFAQYWDEYEGDLDSIIAEVDPQELKVIYSELQSAAEDQGVAEGSDEIRTAGRGAIRIPGDMSAPHWREPTWSFQEIAQKLGIPVSALNLLAFNRIGGFPEALPGLAARYGSKKYYKQSEIKRWVNTNNVREKLKQGMLEGALDDSNFGKSAASMTPTPQAAQQARDIVQQRADDNVISQAEIAGAVPITREGEQQPGADYRDPKEVDYDDEYDAMVARVKRLAGLGPMKTVYDPNKRVYRNMPTAVQPKK